MIKEVVKQVLQSRLFFSLLLKQCRSSSPHIYYVVVNPKAISHISLIPESSGALSGPEAAYGPFIGYFDLIKMPFEKHSMYRTVGQLIRGESWGSTPHYKKMMKNDGENKAIAQLEKLENLLKNLSNEGYLSQYKLGHMNITQKIGELDVPRNETIIGMGRYGNLFRIKGGKHRLAIAQHIGISAMPAILTLYHQDAIGLLPEKRRKITGYPADFRPF